MGIDRAGSSVIFLPRVSEEVMKRWLPPVDCTEREERLLKLAGKSRKLFVFLRKHRHALFTEAFQVELESMYRDSGQGEEPQPPALMCMAMLLQGYLQVSDAEAVRLSATDSCWRLVLGTLAEKGDEPAFSQGGLQQFRDRMVRHDMDRRLLERTVDLAKTSRTFDWKKLPKNLRVAVDSRPLAGAGRVEDTINLLGHAGRKIAECMAAELESTFEEVCRLAGAPLLMASSIKAGLDIDWSDDEAKEEALNRLCQQLERGGTVICKPWGGNNGRTGLFGKKDFDINVRDRTVRCPAGQVEHFEPGQEVKFDPEECGACTLRSKCTQAAAGRGRTVMMGEDEALQKKLRKLQASPAGRERLRERVTVEHGLAHVANRQGPRARYLGLRKNLFDLRRLSAVQNLEAVARRERRRAAA